MLLSWLVVEGYRPLFDHWPGNIRDGVIIKKHIKLYLKNKYSLIPIRKGEKKPCVYWKQYQKRLATFEEILQWIINFNNPNIGIVTGKVSNLTVIDLDDPSKLSVLKKVVPEIENTTRVKTKRGYHYYFSGNNIRSTKNLLNTGIELKGKGNYIVVPPSIINGHKYVFEVPLTKILPLPEVIKREFEFFPKTGKEGNLFNDVVIYNKKIKFPRYHGLGVSCIGQILEKDLKIGERDNSLFILYNLLIQNGNTKDHSKVITRLKNSSLSNSLTDKEINNIFKKPYKYKCSSIIEKLPFVKCYKCKRFKGGLSKMVGSAMIRNIRDLPKISNTERGILTLIDVYFSGEKVTANRISEVAKMDYRIVKKAMDSLKEKGILK